MPEPDRAAIAKRHGIGHLAGKLVGNTAEELEIDAKAKAGIIRLLSPRDLTVQEPEPPEPPVEGMPPRDKPVSVWREEESEASRLAFERTMRERARDEQREAREERERIEAEANRTPDEEHGDIASAALQPGVKLDATRALVRRLHPGDEGHSE